MYTRRAWIRMISMKNWTPSSYTRVCLEHLVNGVGPNFDNRNKIPTKNLPQKRSVVLKKSRESPRKPSHQTQASEDCRPSKKDLNVHSLV